MEGKKNYLISICIVTENNYKYMDILLNSIEDLFDQCCLEVVIIDNNSKDDTIELINHFKRKSKLRITYEQRKSKFSLPENRNLAIKNSKGNIIVLVDSDVKFIDKNFFAAIKEIFQDPSIFVCSPLIIDARTGLTQSLGLSRFLKIPYIFKFNFPKMEPDKVKALTSQMLNIQMIHGACFVFRKSLISKIGYFDEFMTPYNFDEMDFAIRASMKNFKMIATSRISIMHYGGGTTDNFQKLTRAELFISHGFRSLIRNYSSKKITRLILIIIFFAATAFDLFLETKKIASTKVVIKSFIWSVRFKNKPLINNKKCKDKNIIEY